MQNLTTGLREHSIVQPSNNFFNNSKNSSPSEADFFHNQNTVDSVLPSIPPSHFSQNLNPYTYHSEPLLFNSNFGTSELFQRSKTINDLPYEMLDSILNLLDDHDILNLEKVLKRQSASFFNVKNAIKNHKNLRTESVIKKILNYEEVILDKYISYIFFYLSKHHGWKLIEKWSINQDDCLDRMILLIKLFLVNNEIKNRDLIEIFSLLLSDYNIEYLKKSLGNKSDFVHSYTFFISKIIESIDPIHLNDSPEFSKIYHNINKISQYRPRYKIGLIIQFFQSQFGKNLLRVCGKFNKELAKKFLSPYIRELMCTQDPELLKILLSVYSRPRKIYKTNEIFPLHFASNEVIAQLLLDAGFSLKDRSLAHYTSPLLAAASRGSLGILKFIHERNLQTYQLKWCYKSNIADLKKYHVCSGKNTLHLACEKGHIEVAEYLIEQGMSVNVRTKWNKYTPLHLAAEGNHSDMMKFLISKGARIRARNSSGETAYDIIVKKSNIVNWS